MSNLAAGVVRVDGAVVTDPAAPAPWPTGSSSSRPDRSPRWTDLLHHRACGCGVIS
jgi:hypothetical protein